MRLACCGRESQSMTGQIFNVVAASREAQLQRFEESLASSHEVKQQAKLNIVLTKHSSASDSSDFLIYRPSFDLSVACCVLTKII